MELTRKSLQEERKAFEAAGYRLPKFDYGAVREKTLTDPVWIHFGVGRLFRALPANLVQKLLDSGQMDTGLIAVEGYDDEILEKIVRPHDGLSILAALDGHRSVEKTVVGSILESLSLDSGNEGQFGRLKAIFSKPSLQLASFTVTEAGYALRDPAGRLLPEIAADLEGGPDRPGSFLGKVSALLYARYLRGRSPIALVSLDPPADSGDRLREALSLLAGAWCEKGLAKTGFADYVGDPSSVSFPCAIADKISPGPDARVEAMLALDGLGGLEPVTTSRGTCTAPFVHAEKCEYLVVEDAFPNGRPPLEKGGVLFADRAAVERAERMKHCTCPEPLYTALAVFGCLLGYTLIADEMKDSTLRRLVERLGYEEVLPAAADPVILKPKDFLDTMIGKRLTNPFLPDTPQKLAAHTSRKLAVCFGETLKAYAREPSLRADRLRMIPLVFSGWLRYLMGVDDKGHKFPLSPDSRLEELLPFLETYSLDDKKKDLSRLDALLAREDLFGADLFSLGMDRPVKTYFAELSSGIGAVRKTLQKYVKRDPISSKAT